MNNHTTDTRIYGLVGHPLGHSFSSTFFNEKFTREGINARYVNLDMESVTGLRAFIEAHPEIVGLNVTIPHKRNVLPLMDELGEEARATGAVNVICIDRSNGLRLIGQNTDCLGFGASLDATGIPALAPKALILGTGGASAAVAFALEKRGIDHLFVSRSEGHGRITYDSLHANPEILRERTLIINATPLGTYPNVDGKPDLPYTQLTGSHLCMDLVYNPAVTAFMAAAAAQGSAVKNGLMMLHEQARAAWQFWQTLSK